MCRKRLTMSRYSRMAAWMYSSADTCNVNVTNESWHRKWRVTYKNNEFFTLFMMICVSIIMKKEKSRAPATAIALSSNSLWKKIWERKDIEINHETYLDSTCKC